jgi:hypothetical protein
MHKHNSNLNKINSQKKFVNKQIKEDLEHFIDIENNLKKEKKIESNYINDRIKRMQAKISHMEYDLRFKEKELLNIQLNKFNNIKNEKENLIKQEEIDKERLLSLREQILIARKGHDIQKSNKLTLIFRKGNKILNNTINNNTRIINIRKKEVALMIESNKSFIEDLFTEIVDFQNKEIITIKEKKINLHNKYKDRFQVIKTMKMNIISESESKLESIKETESILNN